MTGRVVLEQMGSEIIKEERGKSIAHTAELLRYVTECGGDRRNSKSWAETPVHVSTRKVVFEIFFLAFKKTGACVGSGCDETRRCEPTFPCIITELIQLV